MPRGRERAPSSTCTGWTSSSTTGSTPNERIVFDQVDGRAGGVGGAARAVASAYDFARVETVRDVGGGWDALAIGLVEAYGGTAGPADRCGAVGGDFCEVVPDGGDAYLLKFVLHDWDDERSVSILRTCQRATPPTGRLISVELLVPRGNVPSFAKSRNVNMLVNLGGQERTQAEYRAPFAAAGFDLTGTTSAQGGAVHHRGRPV
jgi:hypothetical protein